MEPDANIKLNIKSARLFIYKPTTGAITAMK